MSSTHDLHPSQFCPPIFQNPNNKIRKIEKGWKGESFNSFQGRWRTVSMNYDDTQSLKHTRSPQQHPPWKPLQKPLCYFVTAVWKRDENLKKRRAQLSRVFSGQLRRINCCFFHIFLFLSFFYYIILLFF